MKKIIFALAFSFLFLGVGYVSASTTTCGNPALNHPDVIDPITSLVTDPAVNNVDCGGGSPERVVNVWGTTNSQLPHIKQGQTVTLTNGSSGYCPAWFPMYCVDITGTTWYKTRFSK